jgi:hypothetical protein
MTQFESPSSAGRMAGAIYYESRCIQNPFCGHIYDIKPFGNVRSVPRHYTEKSLQKFGGKM